MQVEGVGDLDEHARPLLQPGAAGADHGLRDGGPRDHAAPYGLPQSRPARGARRRSGSLQVDWGKSKAGATPSKSSCTPWTAAASCENITTVVAEEHIDIERLASQGDAVPGQCRPVAACRRGRTPGTVALAGAAFRHARRLSAPGAAHENKGTVPSAATSAIRDIDRPLVRGEGSFVHGFRECRMRVDGSLQVFAARGILHRKHGLGNQSRPPSVR